jgi:hypothetical protein
MGRPTFSSKTLSLCNLKTLCKIFQLQGEGLGYGPGAHLVADTDALGQGGKADPALGTMLEVFFQGSAFFSLEFPIHIG